MTTPNTPDCTCRPDPKHPGWWYECPQHVGAHPNPGSLAGHEHRFHSGLCANKPCDVSSSDYIATLEATVRSYQGSVPGIKYRTLEAENKRLRGILNNDWNEENDRLRERVRTLEARLNSSKKTALAALEGRTKAFLRIETLEARLEAAEEEADGAYSERNKVVVALAKHYPHGWSQAEEPGWKILYVDIPTGQVSWHFSDAEYEAVKKQLHPYAHNVVWDGHTTEEKYARLAALTRPATAAEQEAGE